MKKALFIGFVAFALIVLAVGGWTVKGIRRAVRAGRPLRPVYA